MNILWQRLQYHTPNSQKTDHRIYRTLFHMREGQFLLRLFQTNDEVCQAELDEIQTSVLMQLALSHGVLPLLVEKLGAHSPKELTERNRKLTVRLMEYERELTTLANTFREAGIEVLFLKGSSLAFTTYRTPELRTLNDIDILVREVDLPKAASLLRNNKYLPTTPLSTKQARSEHRFRDAREYESPKSSIMVDLHWKLFKNFYGVKLSTQELFQRARLVQIDQCSFLTPCHEDHLLFLCLHGSKHTWSELKWILDITMLLERHTTIDLPELLTRANKKGIARILLLGLALASEFRNTPPLPRGIVSAIEADRVIATMVPEILERIVRDQELGILETAKADLLVRERSIDRFKYLIRRALTPHAEDWKSVDLPDQVYPLYYLVRPLRLLSKYGRRRLRF